ncbi:hypothetical protein HELRODRAFT_67767, partial [Helobdella robusta]|uniref:inositol-polyphosphate 5-phosphatase n=1 Tax=Helobdella robusta TaxID=6412 RepID=T1FZ48_HELRO
PDFIGLHCQEVGGKNYEDTMKHVDKFTRMLLQNEHMSQYKRAYVFLDEDFTAVEKFTALGSLYFIHNSVKDVGIYNFAERTFVPAEGKEVFTGNIEHVPIKEKSKFPKDFFPDGVWSRKGFIRTRWRLYNTVFDLVNLHLFHDASNIVAMEKSPSLYSLHREQALLHTIKRFEDDDHTKVPYFIFGDYNFRLDTHKLIKLKQFDTEPDACKLKLYEYNVTFQPSSPFSEDADECKSYMKTRCPGWCDRIMMSHSCRNIILNVETEVEYAMIGKDVCMGDHKV